ncbi:MAG: type II toxin-antitoxin system VapC family toxin [Deltaproteobacteria bacterium]|nr:type II toxin-antitoxin system VapC family toxin [Deltaproteobacteria bacterium]
MTLVVDASAAVEYLLRTAVGRSLDGPLSSATLVAPELLDAEVLAVLRRETLAGRLAAKRAAEAVEDLRDWDVVRLPHRPLLARAWELRHNVSAYDALYLAAAVLHDAALITADGPLARAPGTGVVVHNVRAGPMRL